MKILVCISNVPDTTSKISFTTDSTKFEKKGVQFVINPHDEFMLTKAIYFQENQGARLTVATVGDVTTDFILRKALAMGVDEAIRVDSEAKDGFFVARQLASICEREKYDLIFTGKESIDYNGGIVGGLLASLLSFDYIDNCIGIEVNEGTIETTREVSDGIEKLIAKIPLVVSGQRGIVEERDLRIPNMRGIMMARKKEIIIIPEEGKIDVPTSFVNFENIPKQGPCKMINPDDIDKLIDLLHNEAKVI